MLTIACHVHPCVGVSPLLVQGQSNVEAPWARTIAFSTTGVELDLCKAPTLKTQAYSEFSVVAADCLQVGSQRDAVKGIRSFKPWSSFEEDQRD